MAENLPRRIHRSNKIEIPASTTLKDGTIIDGARIIDDRDPNYAIWASEVDGAPRQGSSKER